MSQKTLRLVALSRRRFLAWSGVGALVGASALAACQRPAAPAPVASSTSPTAVPALATPTRPTAQPATPTVGRPQSATIVAPPTGDSSTRVNYLHTNGAKILDSANQEVLLAGVNWFGLETETLAPHGIWTRTWQGMLDQIVQLGYNCVRLPFSNELFDPELQPNGIDFFKNPDLKGLTGLQILDRIVVGAGQRGLKIILDQHRPTTDSQSELWNTVELSSADWIAQWQALAKRYLGNDTVVGADLHNEPSGKATWGSGDAQTDWTIAAEACANAIHEVNSYWLIIVEGIEKSEDAFGNVLDWTWQGGELINARARPIKLNVPNRLVYSPHDYGPSVYPQGWFDDPKFPKNLPDFWDFHWGYLHQQSIAPIFLGEFGGPSVGNDPDGQWQRAIVGYLKTNRMHYAYWAFNANSADTGGLLMADWSSVNEGKQQLLASYQGKLLGNRAPDLVDTSAVPKASSTRLPTKTLHFDASNVHWTSKLKPELYVANKTKDPLDLSKVELRYWFAPNGHDDASAFSVRVQGTSVQNFGKVLSPDSVTAAVVADGGQTFGGNPLWYVRVRFGQGVTAPPRDSAGFGLVVERKDTGQFFQPSHYSYRDYHWPSEWNRVGLYQDGKLSWGVEPQTYEATEAAKQRAIDAQRSKFLTG